MNQIAVGQSLYEPLHVLLENCPLDVVFQRKRFDDIRGISRVGQLLPHAGCDLIQGEVLASLEIEKHTSRPGDGAIQDVVTGSCGSRAHWRQGRPMASTCQSRGGRGGVLGTVQP